MSQSEPRAAGGCEGLVPDAPLLKGRERRQEGEAPGPLREIDCEMKAVEEFLEGIREERKEVGTAIRNLFSFCEVMLRDVCRWRDRRQNHGGPKESSVLKEPAEECDEAIGETSAISELMQDLNVKGDEGQEEEHTYEGEASMEEEASGGVEWEDDDDIEGGASEEVNLHEDSLQIENTLLDIEDVVDELRSSPAPDVDPGDGDAEMSVEFLQSLVTLVRRELAAAEEERETLEQHEKSLTEELDALNETRTSFRNASACGQTDGSLNDPVDAEAESPGHEDEEEQVPTIGKSPMDPIKVGESSDATGVLQTTEEESTRCVRQEAPPAVGESAGEATCVLEAEEKENPTLAVSQEDPSKAEDTGYFAAQRERN